MPPLLNTSIFQPRLKCYFKDAKTSYFDPYARPIPKHDLLRYSFTNTVTKYQRVFNRCFTNGALPIGVGALPMVC